MIAANCRSGISKLMSRMISTVCASCRIVLTRLRTVIMMRSVVLNLCIGSYLLHVLALLAAGCGNSKPAEPASDSPARSAPSDDRASPRRQRTTALLFSHSAIV